MCLCWIKLRAASTENIPGDWKQQNLLPGEEGEKTQVLREKGWYLSHIPTSVNKSVVTLGTAEDMNVTVCEICGMPCHHV